MISDESANVRFYTFGAQKCALALIHSQCGEVKIASMKHHNVLQAHSSWQDYSIINQKKLLTKYAKDHHFGNTKVYVDDGYTGTNFNRPGFQEMLEDIEAGYVTTVIIKDKCVNIELNSEGPQKCGFCDVSSVFWPKTEKKTGAGRRKEGRMPINQSNKARLHRAGIAVGEIRQSVSALFSFQPVTYD